MQLQHMATSKLAVIGDVHSNVLALKASLRSICDYEAKVSPVDIIVFIGDLLTYGVCPDETLHEVLELFSTRQTVFVMGNHDQLYADLISGHSFEYYSKMPNWIKESVDYNFGKIDKKMFSEIDFVPFYVSSSVIFSHANFSTLFSCSADWKYINTHDDHFDQLKIISQAGYTLGVLGHTHRARCYSLYRNHTFDGSDSCVNRKVHLDSLITFCDYSASVLNAGSIGQPRESSRLDPSWLLIELENSSVSSAKYISFVYDVDAHLKSIAESGLTFDCIQKLVSFY